MGQVLLNKQFISRDDGWMQWHFSIPFVYDRKAENINHDVIKRVHTSPGDKVAPNNYRGSDKFGPQ